MSTVNKFYLAAPFFNPAQQSLCTDIEVMFADHGVALFSPRQHKANSSHQKLTTSDALDIFACNVENIDDATHMLAVVDWLLPENQQIRLLEQVVPGNFAYPVMKSDALQIPDAGTVWEMGYAFARNKPLIMFTTRQNMPMNIMLSQCCQGIVRGMSHLNSYLNQGHLASEKLNSVNTGINHK